MTIEANRTYNHNGKMNKLLIAVETINERMNLIIQNRTIKEGFFQIILKEKLKLISTNWPMFIELTGNQMENFITLNIRVYTEIWSITAENHVNSIANQILSEIQTITSNPIPVQTQSNIQPNITFTEPDKIQKSQDELKILKQRYRNGEISRHEYKRLKKEIIN